MGFGILFLGYTIATLFSFLGTYSFIGMLVGYFMMFLALCELRKYAPTFLYSIIVSVCIIFCSFFETFAGIDTLLGLGILTHADMIKSVFTVVEFVLEMTFNFVLLYGIADLSRRVDYSDTRTKAFRNMFFVGIACAFQLFLLLPISALEDEMMFLQSLSMVLKIVYSVLNLALFFKCYAFICPAEDVDMPRKPSRFEFVNKWREKSDAKEQEMLDYYNKKAEERIKKKGKKKKK